MAESFKRIDHFRLNIGPHHPSAHGVLRMVAELDGEVVARLDPHIGYLHRGTEKLMESRPYLQCTPYFDRLDYVSPFNQEHAFCLAVEKLGGIEVPPRAQYIRMLFDELNRIASHVVFLGSCGLDIRAQTPIMVVYDIREAVLGFNEKISGARMHMNYVRPGGVAMNVPGYLIEEIYTWCDQAVKAVDEYEALLAENRVFKSRFVNVGVLEAEAALSYGVTGPNLRACGIGYDVRRHVPYEDYDSLSFRVPLGKVGDAYDRWYLRIAEIRESLQLIRQIISKMPTGPYASLDKKPVAPLRRDSRLSMEALIHHFKLYTEGLYLPEGEVYQAVEAPKGEFGVYLVSDGGNKPYRVKIRAPSFYHVQLLPALAEGGALADIMVCLSSIDPIFGETDR